MSGIISNFTINMKPAAPLANGGGVLIPEIIKGTGKNRGRLAETGSYLLAHNPAREPEFNE
jgi:hypothetical protein